MFKNEKYKKIEADYIDSQLKRWYSWKSRKEKDKQEIIEKYNLRKRNKLRFKNLSKTKTPLISCLSFHWKKYESFDKELEYFELFRN
jgi:hypothetical protein